MNLRYGRTRAASAALLALLCVVAGGPAPAEKPQLLARIATADPATLASLRDRLAAVRVLESAVLYRSEATFDPARPAQGFALAWGDAAAVESARRAGVPTEVLGPRRPDSGYAVIHLQPEAVAPSIGRILYRDSVCAILEYPREAEETVWASFESLPVLDRPVVLADRPDRKTFGELPPLPTSADPFCQELVSAVNADSLLAVIRYLQGLGSRRSPEPECVLAADSLAAMLRRHGVPDVSYFDYNDWSDNVVGIQPGRTSPDEWYVISGHYDSYSRGSAAPGADDNGTGTAAVIEAARILGRQQLEATIVYIAFSGEEQGLVGSEAWAAAARRRNRDIRGALNLDMIGWRAFDDPADVDLISNHLSLDLRDFVETAAALYLPGYGVVGGAFGGGNSDQQSFWDQGYPALTFFEDSDTRNPHYHSDHDVIGLSVNDPEFLRHNVQVAVAALTELARPIRLRLTHQPPADPSLSAAGYPISARIVAGGRLVSDSLRLRFRVDGGAFSDLPLLPTAGPDVYAAVIPGQPPGALVEYYLQARDDAGRQVRDPARAPDALHAFMVGRAVAFHDTFSQDRGWTVGAPEDGAISGVWTRARPIGTGPQTGDDADGDSLCFLTGNGEPEGAAGEADLDGGRTTLTSPRIDLDRAVTADLKFFYWFADETYPDDTLRVQVSSDDGATWVALASIADSQRRWREWRTPRLEELLPLRAGMRLRFTVADEGRASLLEAAIDGIRVQAVTLPAPPPPEMPPVTRLLMPRPDPFRSSMTIRYDLATSAEVDLSVFDVQGRRVADIWRGAHAAGADSIPWDGLDSEGRPLRSGVYFLRLQAGGTVSSRRIVRVR